MESKLVEQLRALKIFNSYDFYERGATPYISRYGRSADGWSGSCWVISYRREGENALRSAKIAYTGRSTVNTAFEKLKAWALKEFGITEWVRDPFGTFGPADFVQKRLETLGLF